ncbi:mucin-2-like [Topomyia yanbarensis]|uniref:mucin-2-like n=1 Tax=Topomyia yanbarensis TaxID=2498891 RepID=UPI00273BA902|nr:mucin-2-like [Topomyia yanbarensis]
MQPPSRGLRPPSGFQTPSSQTSVLRDASFGIPAFQSVSITQTSSTGDLRPPVRSTKLQPPSALSRSGLKVPTGLQTHASISYANKSFERNIPMPKSVRIPEPSIPKLAPLKVSRVLSTSILLKPSLIQGSASESLTIKQTTPEERRIAAAAPVSTQVLPEIRRIAPPARYQTATHVPRPNQATPEQSRIAPPTWSQSPAAAPASKPTPSEQRRIALPTQLQPPTLRLVPPSAIGIPSLQVPTPRLTPGSAPTLVPQRKVQRTPVSTARLSPMTPRRQPSVIHKTPVSALRPKTSPMTPQRIPIGVPETPVSIVRPTTAPMTTPYRTPKVAAPIPLPRTAVKKRIETINPDAEVFNIAGREVEFVDWAPSPEAELVAAIAKRPVTRPSGSTSIVKGLIHSRSSPSGIQTLQVPVARPPKERKIYNFPDEPSVTAAKQLSTQISSDLAKFKQMGTDMQELKDRKSSILGRIKNMYAAEGKSVKESTELDKEKFREKFGFKRSPKKRQLLELTGEWSRDILEKQQFQERLTQATPMTPQARKKVVPSLEHIKESSEAMSPQAANRRAEIELTRKEKIDDYRQRMEVHKEFRQLLEERKKNILSRRPLSKQEREEVRKLYQEAKETLYTAATEEELDNAVRLAEIMELEEAGVSLKDSPNKTAKELLPEMAPTAEISGIVGDILIPAIIPVEEMNTITSLDRNTAEVALKASLVPAPAGEAATKLLESG